jgi:hypothetical protein
MRWAGYVSRMGHFKLLIESQEINYLVYLHLDVRTLQMILQK